jgi:hypothetical protein
LERYEPVVYEQVMRREHDTLIVHEDDIGSIDLQGGCLTLYAPQGQRISLHPCLFALREVANPPLGAADRPGERFEGLWPKGFVVLYNEAPHLKIDSPPAWSAD